MNHRSSLVHGLGLAALISIAAMVSGFKIVSPEELAAIRDEGSSPAVNGGSLLHDDIIPWATSSSRDIGQVLSAIEEQGFQTACEKYGVQESQAFPCTFWVQLSGEVESVDTSSRVGKVNLSGAGGAEVVVLTGPVIPGTALRDGYPEIAYNDFDNQSAYATLADELNGEVVSIIADFGEISAGDQLSVVGAYSSWGGMGSSIQIVPISLDNGGGE